MRLVQLAGIVYLLTWTVGGLVLAPANALCTGFGCPKLSAAAIWLLVSAVSGGLAWLLIRLRARTT
jgi:hypothetical protein